MAKKESKQKEEKKKKGKAGKNSSSAADKKADANTGATNINNVPLDRSQMTADQLTQAQIEEAIKESQDPASKLRKVRSPISVRNCLINILILIVLTVGIVLLCCYFMLDKETFNLGVVVKDILDKFKITNFFRAIGNWFKKIFS